MGLFSKAGRILRQEGKHLGSDIDRFREKMTVTTKDRESLNKLQVKAIIAHRKVQRYSKRVDKNLPEYLWGKRRKK